MANIANRAAEYGSEIIEDTDLHGFSPSKPVIALRILEDTTFTTLTSPNTVNIAYYVTNGALAGENILGNIATLKLATGAVQAIF